MFDNVMARRKVKTMSEKIGRFEYVKRSLVGVCAATMLAGMCAVPAFAEATDESAETPVTIDTSAVNISVTLPTTPVSAVVNADGAFADVAGGSIENKSVCGVHVSQIEVAKTSGSSMTLQGATAFDSSDNATKNAAKLNAVIGSVNLDLADYATAKAPATAINLATNASQAVTLSGQVKNLTGTTMNESALSFVTIKWTVAADAS